MGLPQIDVPLFELILPCSGKKITYRPFLVKEKKILMIAKEQGGKDLIYNAIRQVATNCTLGKVDVDTMGLVDLQYLFLKIRCKSVGESSEFVLGCSGCKADVTVSVDLDSIEVKRTPSHTNKIMLGGNIGVIMKYPDITFEKMWGSQKTDVEKEITMVSMCVDTIFDGETVYKSEEVPLVEIEEMIENLTEENYIKIQQFFSTMPVLEKKIAYKCPKCNLEDTLVVNDLADFFA